MRPHLKCSFSSKKSSGVILLLFALLIPLFLFLLALTLGIGHQLVIKNQLQTVADASALAGAVELNQGLRTVREAVLKIFKNNPIESKPLNPNQMTLELGVWEPQTQTFTATPHGSNSVKISLRYPIQYPGFGFKGLKTPTLTAMAIGYRTKNHPRKDSIKLAK